MTPEPSQLQKAAGRGDLQALTALLDDGAEVDAAANNGSTALACAAGSGQRDAVCLLRGHGADVNAGSAGTSSSGLQVAGARSSALWNFGGSYNFTPDFSLLFSAGHSFQGDGNGVMYLGLYRTWGPGSP